MQEWNVVITVHDFQKACDILGDYGRLRRTEFYNTLFMNVPDTHELLEAVLNRSAEDQELFRCVSRIIPVSKTFTFQSREEFENKSKDLILAWIDELAGKSFHVRMRRRGFKGRLSSLEEEQFLDSVLLRALAGAGTPGQVTFENPDAIIAVETIANWAGLSLWTRAQLKRYPFLRIDN